MADETTTLADLIDPEVNAPIVSYQLQHAMRFTPLAQVDNTLVGRPGDTLQFPKFTYIGQAKNVPEGTALPTNKLGTKMAKVKVQKAGNGVEITDEAALSGLGDSVSEANRQIATSIADYIDDQLLTAAEGGSQKVTIEPTVEGVQDALDIFSDEDDSTVVAVVNPATAAKLRLDAIQQHAGSDVIANALIRGTYFDILGVQIVRSKKVNTNEAIFIKASSTSPALKLVMKRGLTYETERHAKTRSTWLSADEHFAAYLYDDTKVVVATISESSSSTTKP